MSKVIKRTGRKDKPEPTERDKPLEKWRLTFSRERYPTVPVIVRKSAGPVEKDEKNGGDSN